jgi:nitroreductase
METARTMEQKSEWKRQMEEIVAKQALALNYEYGITCRVLPARTEGTTHQMALALDLTHSSHDFDLEWVVSFGDRPEDPIESRLVGPETVGGALWQETHRSIDDFRRALTGLPYYVQAFFAGRRSQERGEDAIHGRRSIKRFQDQAVSRQEIEKLIEAAIQAPNHKLTQPWKFYVLGPQAREAYGTALGKRKAKKATDAQQAAEITNKVAQEHRALPAMIAVAMTQAEEPEMREEDYAATYMAIQNLALTAHELGLGTHIKTGAVMSDPEARVAIGVADGERVVATIHVGKPAEVPAARPRKGPAEVTVWKA